MYKSKNQKTHAMKTIVLFPLALCVAAALTACEANGGDKENMAEDKQAFTDTTFTDARDGKTYRTVKLGGQTWMAENLDYQTKKSWCYDNNPENCKIYGRLYTWDAARKACPAGWRLPDTSDWLPILAASSFDTAATMLKSKAPDWDGTDDYGFSALPGGTRDPDGSFTFIGSWGFWWMGTKSGFFNAWVLLMQTGDTYAKGFENPKGYGNSVRCLRD
jgi:uncharacterized protein (TIGR02145 family)